MFGLERILAPITIDDFLSKYSGRQAVHIPGPADKFERLYGWDEVNNVLNGMRPSMEGVRLVHETKSLPQEEHRRMSQWLAKGATLVINHVQHIDPIAEQFAESLANDVNSRININCYVSFPSRQGFDCHYDTHEVFVIQTVGRKEWKVFEPSRRFPLDSDPADEKNKYTKPKEGEYLSCELTPGDVLYIPRGHWHYALSSESCVHLTVSYSNRSGVDFLGWLLSGWRDHDEFLRRDFPLCRVESLRGDRSDEALVEHLERFKAHVAELIQRDDLQERLLQWVQVENVMRQPYRLPELAGLDREPIGRDVKFQLTRNQKVVPRFDSDTGQIQLIERGGVVVLNRVPRKLVEVMLQPGRAFSGADLLAAAPEVSWDDVQKMLQNLFVAGLIVLLEPEEP